MALQVDPAASSPLVARKVTLWRVLGVETVMPLRRALFTLVSLTFACRDMADDGAVSEEMNVAELAACAETDLESIPMMGPAFDDEGVLLAPLPLPHVVATTVGWNATDKQEVLTSYTTPVMMDVMTQDGLLGFSFALSEHCGSARTLTLWRDEAALMKFVFEKVHGMAIRDGVQHSLGWETTHWTETSVDRPPSWYTLKERLAAMRRE